MGGSGGRVPKDDDGLIVPRPRAPREGLDTLEDEVGQRPGGKRVVVRDELLQAGHTEVLSDRAGRLGDSVGVEDDDVRGAHADVTALVTRVGVGPSTRPPWSSSWNLPSW